MIFRKGKKKKVDEDDDDLDLDDFEMDDFDEFDDFDGEPRKPTARQLGGTVAKTAGKKLAEDTRKKVVKDLIPGEFEENLTELKDFASETKDLIKESTKDITNTIGKVLPKSLAEKLGILPDGPERKVSEAETREASIQSALGMFNKGGPNASPEEKKEKVRQDRDKKRQLYLETNKLANDKMANNLLGNISNDISGLNGFFLNIGSEYFKKSLELQYRSYYLQMDLLKTNSTFFKGITAQLDNIVKNTGLPEHVKITQAERVEGKLKDALATKVYDTMFTNNAFVQNIKKNVKRKIKDVTDSIKGGVEMGAGMFDMGGGVVDNRTILATMLGNLIGEKGSKKLYDKFGKRIKDKWGDSEFLQSLGYTTENIVRHTGTTAERAKAYAARAAEEAEDKEGLKGSIGRAFWKFANNGLALTDYQRRNLSLKQEGIDDLNAPAIFDKSVYRNITDAIPMYLARILQQNTDLAGMYKTVHQGKLESFVGADLLVYNQVSRKLDTMSGYRSSIQKLLTGKDVKGSMKASGSRAVASVVNELNKNKKDNKEVLRVLKSKSNQEKLSEYFSEVGSMEGIDGNYDILVNNALSENANPNVAAYLAEHPEVKDLIKTLKEGADKAGDGIKKGISSDLKRSNANAKNNYPVGTLSDLFEAASKLAGKSKTINKLEIEEANVIGRAIANYILTTRQGIFADIDVLKKVFNSENVKADPGSSALTKIGIFIDDVNTVINSDVRSKIELLNKFFDMVNVAIKAKTQLGGTGADKFMEQMGVIQNLNAELHDGNTTMNVDAIFDGAIGAKEKESLLNQSTFDSMFRGKETKELRTFIDNSKLIDGMENYKGKIKDILNSHDNPVDAWVEIAKTVKTDVTELASKAYDKANKKAGEISEKFGKLLDKFSVDSLKKFLNYLHSLTKDIDEIIKDETDAYSKSSEDLRKLMNNINDNTENDIEKLRKQMAELEERHKKRIASYEVLKKTVTELIQMTNSLVEKADKMNTKEIVIELKEIIQSKTIELKELAKALVKEKV